MSNKSCLFLFCVFSIYIIYGTTIPFDFTSSQIVLDKINQLSWIPFHSIPVRGLLISDIVQNVLFFIPVGLFGLLSFNNTRKFISITGIVFYGFLLSTAVESAQLFSLTRNTSVTDIATNTIGTVVGELIALLIIRLKMFEKIKIPNGKESRLLLLISIVMFADKLRPFDLSLNINYMSSKLFRLQNSVTNLFVIGNNDLFNLMTTAIFTYLLVKNVKMLRKPLSLIIFLLLLPLPFYLEIVKVIVISRSPDLHNMLIAFLGVISGLSANLFVYWKRMYSGILLIAGIFISVILKITQLETGNFSQYATNYSCNVMVNLSKYVGLVTLFAVTGFIIDYYLKRKTFEITTTAIMIGIVISGVFFVKGDWLGTIVSVVAVGLGKWICKRLIM